jgi:hypothetical protein
MGRVSNLGRGEIRPSSKNVQTLSVSPSSLLFKKYFSSSGVKRPGLRLTTHHVHATLRVSGAIPLLHLYAFTRRTGRTFTSYLLLFICITHTVLRLVTFYLSWKNIGLLWLVRDLPSRRWPLWSRDERLNTAMSSYVGFTMFRLAT